MPLRKGDVKRLEGQRGVVSSKYKTREVEVERAWIHKGMWILKLKGVDTIKEAWRLRDSYLEIAEDVFPEEDTPIGYDVYNEREEYLGKVVEMLSTPAHDVIVTDKEIFIPFVKEWILFLTPSEKKLIVKELKVK